MFQFGCYNQSEKLSCEKMKFCTQIIAPNPTPCTQPTPEAIPSRVKGDQNEESKAFAEGQHWRKTVQPILDPARKTGIEDEPPHPQVSMHSAGIVYVIVYGTGICICGERG
jgi:hypothetical protein